MKTCSRCKEEKPSTLEVFSERKASSDGLHCWCRSCVSEYSTVYNQTPKGKKSKKKSNAKFNKSASGKLTKRLAESRRRARIKENGVEKFNYEDLRMFWLGQNILDDRCYYCLKSLPGGPEHIDHYIPIAKGGSHTKVNLRPSCAFCNHSKKDKNPIQFMKEDK